MVKTINMWSSTQIMHLCCLCTCYIWLRRRLAILRDSFHMIRANHAWLCGAPRITSLVLSQRALPFIFLILSFHSYLLGVAAWCNLFQINQSGDGAIKSIIPTRGLQRGICNAFGLVKIQPQSLNSNNNIESRRKLCQRTTVNKYQMPI